MSFNKDFYWGCATSSYQIEGGDREDGRGLNIWDVFGKDEGRILDGHTGEIACDHYHRFKEDVDIMAALGLKAYRFSINWARVMPDGFGKVNEKGIKFYSDLIDYLLEKGITPFVTLYHWELPYEIHKRGGWMNPDIVEWFGDYAALISDRFSDRVTHFFTLNEPQVFIGLGYNTGEHAPGLKCTLTDQLIMHQNVLKAQGRGVQRLREKAHQPLEVGFAPTGSMNYPASDDPKDIEACRMHFFSQDPRLERWAWSVSAWSDPVILGSFPEDFLERYEAFMPHYTDADMKLISEPTDIYGQNMYNGHEIRMGENGQPETVERKVGFPITGNNWPVTPDSMYWGPRFLYERYKKPLYITENGCCYPDFVSLDGRVHDSDRVNFLQKYLGRLEDVTEEIDLRGYFEWSLLDNFEWNFGYRDRFGIVYVDYETQERTLKDSAYWYRDFIKSRTKNQKKK